MTEGGGSQKKVNNQLQWKEKKPTSKEYMDYWLGVGKTKNTKGNRKQMLAKIIGAQVNNSLSHRTDAHIAEIIIINGYYLMNIFIIQNN